MTSVLRVGVLISENPSIREHGAGGTATCGKIVVLWEPEASEMDTQTALWGSHRRLLCSWETWTVCAVS